MNACALAIGLGAFLLFEVQLILARFILPHFGGGPAVWTACMLSYQCLLLAGYALAHASCRWLRPRDQAVLHLALVVLSLAFLPPIPSLMWPTGSAEQPTSRVWMLLVATIGVPFITLSATTPLVQGWFGALYPGRSPYRLYALSNAGSLTALVAYPFLVEPLFTRRTQAWMWTGVFAAYAVVIALAARQVWSLPPERRPASVTPIMPSRPQSAPWMLWIGLATCGSGLLMAITDRLAQDVAVVPFLWVLPLGIYLVSFIVCFDRPALYRRIFFLPAMACFALIIAAQPGLNAWPITWLLATYSVGLFVACMVCHGELHRLRPPGDHSFFYLAVALGGALGGGFEALVAPWLFVAQGELAWILCLVGLMLAAILAREGSTVSCRGLRRRVWPAVGLATAAIAGLVGMRSRSDAEGILERSRNFHGSLSVEDICPDDPQLHGHTLMHGLICHGAQFVDPAKAPTPLSYYGTMSGVGLAFETIPVENGRRIGVVGLGAGTLAAYGRDGDNFRFYEIDPAVERLARKWFTYLADSAARCDVVIGDARLSLEQEPDQRFDLLVIDAFSGDAIPVHLMTQEVFATYFRHLSPKGVIAVHISSQHLDLCRVLVGMAADFRRQQKPLFMARVINPLGNEPLPPAINSSIWMLLSRDPSFLQQPAIARRSSPIRPTEPSASPVTWTDDYASLFAVLNENRIGWIPLLGR
jgi:hypothetical protein